MAALLHTIHNQAVKLRSRKGMKILSSRSNSQLQIMQPSVVTLFIYFVFVGLD